MKERPIIFSAPMVRAILEGRKMQTRRVVKPVSDDDGFVLLDYGQGPWPYRSSDGETPMRVVKRGGKLYLDETPHACPYGQPGDGLWVRETFQRFTDDGEILYKADPAGAAAMNELKHDECLEARWRPAIHMPRWASRILLEVTGVRVERLADISKDDAMSEGIVSQHDGGFGLADSTHYDFVDPVESYASLWESINGPGSWEANPWVWVVEFKRVQP